MIETLDQMPPGTLGFRATGKVTGPEYRAGLLPAMRAAAEAGEVRMVLVVGPEFEEFEPDALMEGTAADLRLGLGHLSAWKRTALVTDVESIAKAFHLFA